MARSRHVEEKLHGQFRVVGLHGKGQVEAGLAVGRTRVSSVYAIGEDGLDAFARAGEFDVGIARWHTPRQQELSPRGRT